MFTKSIKDFFKNPIITVPSVLFSILTQILLYFTIGKMTIDESIITNEFADPNIAIQYLSKFLLFGLILMLFYLFISPLITSWTNIMCRDAVNGEKQSIIDALKQSFRFYFRMLGAIVLTFLILMGVYIIFVILIAIPLVPLAMSQTQSSSILAVVLIVILIFVFLLAMVFMTVCLTPIHPLLIYDDLGVIDSISKGFKFGFKKFFPILGVFMIVMVIGLAITIPASFIPPVGTFIATAITSYLSIFTIVFTMNLYKDYKIKSSLPPAAPQFDMKNMEYRPYNPYNPAQNISDENVYKHPAPNHKDENDDDDEPNNKFTV